MNISVRSKQLNQQGFASLVIAIVLIIVLSLITVGFATLMRKEQRSALDKHLSSQAYYAAEAGVNDAAKAINAGFSGEKTACKPFDNTDTRPGVQFLRQNQVGSASSGVKYTCLLMNPAPNSLEYGDISDVQSTSAELSSFDATGLNAVPLSSLFVSWQASGGDLPFVTGQDTNHTFYKADNWPYTPVLRITLTPLRSSCVQRQCMQDNTFTAFLYPNESATATGADTANPGYNTIQYGPSTGTDQGSIVNGKCNNNSVPLSCNVEITNLDLSVNYLITLRSVYGGARVHIAGHDRSSNYVRFKNAQTAVDSTGKAQDILRRIQVRIPSRNEYPHSDYGIEAMAGICKQLELYPDSSSKNNCTP
jgi:hypothetical protein